MLNPESGLDSLREALAGIDAWGARFAAVSVSSPTGILASHGDTTRVLVLTTFDTDQLVIEALRAGANGFLLKDTPPADIITELRKLEAQIAGGLDELEAMLG